MAEARTTGYVNAEDLLVDDKMKYSSRQWEHMLIKLGSKISSLTICEAAAHENDTGTYNSMTRVTPLRP